METLQALGSVDAGLWHREIVKFCFDAASHRGGGVPTALGQSVCCFPRLLGEEFLAPGEFFQRPRLDDVYAFQRRLWSHGRLCTVRAQRGDDESSACGQLVVGDKREAREERVSSLKDSAS